MKKLTVFLCMLALLLTCGCTALFPTATDATTSTAPATEQTLPTTEAIPEETDSMQLSSVFAQYSDAITAPQDEGMLIGVVFNEPYDVPEPEATVTWAESEYERAYIMPAYVGSRVALYELIWDESGNMTVADEPTYCVESSEDGCVIYSALTRPEGYPMYYLEITAPNANTVGYVLSYNGNTGTPPQEYLFTK